MSHHGDITLGKTLTFLFTTVGATGAPTTLAGTPSLSAYVDGGTTQITSGVAVSVDLDSKTGMHKGSVVASTGNGFAAGTDVAVVIEAGTVGGVSAVGYVVAEFSIENRPLTQAQAEPAQGTPAVNASPLVKLAFLYKAWRNRKTQSVTDFSLYNDDATTVDHKATVADSGTVASITEIVSGP